MKDLRWGVIGLVVWLLPLAAAAGLCLRRAGWEPAERGPAPEKLWLPQPRPESATGRAARLARLRDGLRQSARDWATAVKSGRTADFAWDRSLAANVYPTHAPPSLPPTAPPPGFTTLRLSCHGATAALAPVGYYVINTDAGRVPEVRSATGAVLGPSDPRYALLVAYVGDAPGYTYLWAFTVTVSARSGRGARRSTSKLVLAGYNGGHSRGPEQSGALEGRGWLSQPAGQTSAGGR